MQRVLSLNQALVESFTQPAFQQQLKQHQISQPEAQIQAATDRRTAAAETEVPATATAEGRVTDFDTLECCGIE